MFLPYMSMAAILVNGPRPFWQSFVPLPQGGSIRNLSDIGHEALEEMSFKIFYIFPYQYMGPI